MIQSNITVSVSGGSRPITATVLDVGTQGIDIDTAFAAGSADVAYPISFTIAGLQSIMLVASTNMTIKTNSSSSPSQTIDLVAGAPLVWSRSADNAANPFTADVTAFYISCTAGSSLKGFAVKA